LKGKWSRSVGVGKLETEAIGRRSGNGGGPALWKVDRGCVGVRNVGVRRRGAPVK